MVDMAFFRGGLGRWLPPSVPPVDEAVLLRRCWELLVLDRPGTARLAVLGRAPLCRTVLLPQENTAAPLRAQQVVGCGLSPRCSLTLSGLTPRPVLCVQRRLTAVNGAAIEPPAPGCWRRAVCRTEKQEERPHGRSSCFLPGFPCRCQHKVSSFSVNSLSLIWNKVMLWLRP